MSKDKVIHEKKKLDNGHEHEVMSYTHWKIQVERDCNVATVDIDHVNEDKNKYNANVQVYWTPDDLRRIAKMFNKIADEMDQENDFYYKTAQDILKMPFKNIDEFTDYMKKLNAENEDTTNKIFSCMSIIAKVDYEDTDAVEKAIDQVYERVYGY